MVAWIRARAGEAVRRDRSDPLVVAERNQGGTRGCCQDLKVSVSHPSGDANPQLYEKQEKLQRVKPGVLTRHAVTCSPAALPVGTTATVILLPCSGVQAVVPSSPAWLLGEV